MKKTIFVVEDDPDISQLIRHHLESSGYSAVLFLRTEKVLRAAQEQKPALFLLDIMLPGGSGLDLCRRIREDTSLGLALTPVMFLTAKTSESDRVFGLELGADDYMTKPFSPRELVARVNAVLRRFERPLGPAVLNAGDLRIDTGSMTVTVRGTHAPMTATEFRLLDYLARHPGIVFTRGQILDAVWRETQYVTPRSVDVYVRKLREKIERNPESPQYIRTMRGAGYRFEVPR